MIYNNNNIDIIVEGKRVDIFSTKSLNIRMNNVIFNPEEISTSQAEYSFSFELPTSPNNCEIFGFTNIISTKWGRFATTYKAQIYANEILVFDGILKVTCVSVERFKCNLVSPKVNKVNDIFKDTKMNELKWEIPFDGIDTINKTNRDYNSDYYFPLVSYGVFQKEPEESYGNDSNFYTPKYTIDQYNKWYLESFPPSIKFTNP